MSLLGQDEPIRSKLIELQREVRRVVRASLLRSGASDVSHSTSADTIYGIDTDVEPVVVDFCNHWSRSLPLVLVAEGVCDERGVEGPRAFPAGSRVDEAPVRILIDPIDGTRGLMYDKRAAWCLAGVAPNRGSETRLRDIAVAAMVELPTSKAGLGDELSAVRGRGVVSHRVELESGNAVPHRFTPSRATTLAHGFASVVSFFPGTKHLSAELIERIASELIGRASSTHAQLFDDQYIATGGQWYELIAGHDRFTCDLRPEFYRMAGMPPGLCCHPYDAAAWLVAEEAGVILTDATGAPLDGPFDTTSDLAWVGYANPAIRASVEPIVQAFLKTKSVLTNR
jgi:fructose-1,6-bisphosphatase/inositol monophosphatase family enzyme